jgi:hypothetical protein
MIVDAGIGCRTAALARTQRLAARLFTERERDLPPRAPGVTSWPVSLSHDGGAATAVVIAEGGAD